MQDASESAGLVLELERRFATPRPIVDVVDEHLDGHSRPPSHCDLLAVTPPHFSYLRTGHLFLPVPGLGFGEIARVPLVLSMGQIRYSDQAGADVVSAKGYEPTTGSPGTR